MLMCLVINFCIQILGEQNRLQLDMSDLDSQLDFYQHKILFKKNGLLNIDQLNFKTL